MNSSMLEFGDTIPPGLSCIGCRYDLAGLPWGAVCPECGYRAPKTWPTIALDEAHPAFVIHMGDRFKSLSGAQAIITLGFAGLAIAMVISGIRTIQDMGPLIGWVSGAVLFVGLIRLAIELVHLAIPHKNRRPRLDFPHSKAITWSLGISAGSLCLLPVLAPMVFALAPWSLMECAVIPVLSISAIASVSLLYHTFAHASTTIERCGESPAWSSPQRIIVVVLIVWPSTLIYAWASSSDTGVVIALLVFGAFLAALHALRMRRAHRAVAELLRRRREATSEDQPPAPPRS